MCGSKHEARDNYYDANTASYPTPLLVIICRKYVSFITKEIKRAYLLKPNRNDRLPTFLNFKLNSMFLKSRSWLQLRDRIGIN